MSPTLHCPDSFDFKIPQIFILASSSSLLDITTGWVQHFIVQIHLISNFQLFSCSHFSPAPASDEPRLTFSQAILFLSFPADQVWMISPSFNTNWYPFLSYMPSNRKTSYFVLQCHVMIDAFLWHFNFANNSQQFVRDVTFWPQQPWVDCNLWGFPGWT